MDDLTNFNIWWEKSIENVNRDYPKEADKYFLTDDNGVGLDVESMITPSQKRIVDIIKSRYFCLNGDIVKLLLNTKNKIKFREMPFNNIFIDVNLFDGLVEGLLISLLVNNKDEKIIKDIQIHVRWNPLILKKDYNHEKMFTSFRINSFQNEKTKTKNYFTGPVDFKDEEDKLLIENLHKSSYIDSIGLFVCNLLDILNHQDVEIIEGKKWFNNDKRKSRGQPPIPQNFSINLKGKLKRYINETAQKNENLWKVGYRFWVRGHWKHFQSFRYKNKQGQKTWVLPYIKGKGELVKKDYYVGEKEQCWENEKQMIAIIKEMYLGDNVETHNRTILNGLEIDCYIPEIKLGFEYNGKQHYEHVEIFHKTIEDFEKQKERDIEKLKRAEKKGIKIITIKYDEPLTRENILNRIEATQ